LRTCTECIRNRLLFSKWVKRLTRTLLLFIIHNGVRLSPLGTVATTGLLYQPQMIDDGDCGTIGGMKIDRGNWSTGRKPAPVPLCSPWIPHDLTRAGTRASTVGSQWLTDLAMAWSILKHCLGMFQYGVTAIYFYF
jgi:hypothetical protein